MSDESRLHERIEKLRGKWQIQTNWGEIAVSLRPFRIGYASSKGTPDELLVINVAFPLFGEEVSLQMPILLEMEPKGGTPSSLEDAEKFVKRMLTGEEKDIYYKYTETSMFVVGIKRRSKIIDAPLRAKIKIKEIPSIV